MFTMWVISMLPNVIQWIPMMISTMFHNQTFIKLAFFCSLGQPVQGIATCTTVHFNLLHTCNYTLVPRLPLLAEVRWVGPKGAHTANYCKHKALHSLDSILLTVAVWTWTTKPSYIYISQVLIRHWDISIDYMRFRPYFQCPNGKHGVP